MSWSSDEPAVDSAGTAVLSDVEARVLSRLRGQVHHFALAARDGGLVLHGSSPTFYAKQLAQHAVMQATNLPILANEIRVL
jgi:hypothetical protein